MIIRYVEEEECRARTCLVTRVDELLHVLSIVDDCFDERPRLAAG